MSSKELRRVMHMFVGLDKEGI